MAKKAKKGKRQVLSFKNKSAAHKAAAGKWGSYVQYVRKAKKGYRLYRYKK